LGGTCNNTTWRKEFEDNLQIDYFNPVVNNWTKDDYINELKKRISKKTPKKNETIDKKPVKYSSGYTFNIKDFVVINREDNDKLEEFKTQFEKGGLKFQFWSMGEFYYKKQNNG